ncbi:hypothetical protein ACJMK2_017373 [Sinanodonta woodiana]|uniref:SGNH hydrolase-type esterase domain-containing protein n=1 Tax=Sinanodonta woodiana TaxID=1069815 RepID=A0ABD3UA36_SINWO
MGQTRRRRDPNPNNRWIRLFYQILQAIHHLNIMKDQAKGLGATKGFKQQIKLLDKFLKPAQPTTGLTQELERLNRMWATKVAETLTHHYKTRISELMGRIVGFGFLDFTITNLSNQALDWAKRNFRNKLSLDTIQEYQRIVKSFTTAPIRQQTDSTREPQTTTKTVNNKGVSKAWDINQWIPVSLPQKQRTQQKTASPPKAADNPIRLSNRFQPLQVLDTPPHRKPDNQLASTPKPSPSTQMVNSERQQPRDPSLSPTKQTMASIVLTTPLNMLKDATSVTSRLGKPLGDTISDIFTLRTPSPKPNMSPGRRSRSPSRSPSHCSSRSMSPCFPVQTYAAIALSPPKTTRFTRHHGNKAEWKLPRFTHSTVIIGDSNVSRIRNETGNKHLQIESYPGARICHFEAMFRNYQHQDKPKEIIINVGINDRDNNNNTRVAQSMTNLAQIARATFPDSEIFLTQNQVSNTMDERRPREAFNIRQLNEHLTNITMQGVSYLDSNIRGGCFFEPDGIHWCPRTANSILNKWLQQLRVYRPVFCPVQKGTARTMKRN